MSDIFRSVFYERHVSIMSKFRFLEMRIEVLDGTVSLLTAWILFLLVAAVGSYDRVGMWSSKISLLAHERFKRLI